MRKVLGFYRVKKKKEGKGEGQETSGRNVSSRAVCPSCYVAGQVFNFYTDWCSALSLRQPPRRL